MILGHIGLAVSFVLLVSILLWFLIATKTNVLIKIFIIPFVIWFGLALYYVPNSLMGWPAFEPSIYDLPGESIVLDVRVKEPHNDKPGWLYFYLLTPAVEDSGFTISPKEVFSYKGGDDPQLFKIPYDRELHEKFVEAAKKRSKKAGSIMRLKNLADGKLAKNKGESNRSSDDNSPFEIIGIEEFFSKDEQ